MDLLFHNASGDPRAWKYAIDRHLPGSRIHDAPAATACDYALVWKPPPDAFAGQSWLRAVFNIGAGVDALIGHPGLPVGVPLIRLEDAGMASQMVEYVTWGVLHHYRRFGDYAEQAALGHWKPRPVARPGSLTVGVLGLGVLGTAVLDALRAFGFTLAGWSRSPKSVAGVATYAGRGACLPFLARCNVLVCLLPLTPDTRFLLDARALAALPRGAFLINVARGDLVAEDDLLAALDSGALGGALLDVFHEEPLPPNHRLWRHPRVIVTPHVSAATLVEDSIAQIAAKIRRLERGESVSGVVDRALAY